MELLTALETYCQTWNINNFELYQRFSKEKINPVRWDDTFIEKELSRGDPKEIKKILVCGPPVMNETFDRALSYRTDGRLSFRRDQVEVL
jgi:hypothetical protein